MKPERTLKVPTGAILSKYLRALALDIETTNEDGDPITKAAALAALVWKHALGFEEPPEDKKSKPKKIPPATWAIELLYNRIEGKVMTAPPEDSSPSLTDRVTELGRARANSLAKASVEDEDVDEDS